jgi:hypothetical protein
MPSSLAGLLSLLAPCFTQPTFHTFSMLVVGFVGRVRDCTVTGMLQAAGLAGCWHHSRAHDFFARARWEPDQLGLRLADFLLTLFVKQDRPIRLAVDDTLFGRSGRKVFGAHYLHDGAQPEGSGRRTRWGNCWVVVVLVVQLDCLGGRQVGLPILFRLFRPKDDARPELDAQRPSQPELARVLIDMILQRFPNRIVQLVCDGAYASKAWQGLPQRVSVTSRMRSNAAVYELAPAQRRPGQQGRTPLKGPKASKPHPDRQHRRLHPGHGHRPRRAHPHRVHPRDRLPVVQAVSHPPGQGDPDPQPRPRGRIRRRAGLDRHRDPCARADRPL